MHNLSYTVMTAKAKGEEKKVEEKKNFKGISIT